VSGESPPRLADVGEKEFLRNLLGRLPRHRTFINGFGDDASAVSIPGSEEVLFFKIDRAATPMAARRGWADYRMWGRLAVTSNCSDILAAGGAPAAVMIAMVLPRSWSARSAEEIVLGCAEECERHDVAFAGGDTKEGSTAEVIGSAVGFGKRGQLLSRRGARPGDVLVVAGRLGGFLGAYLRLLRDDGRDPTALAYVSHPVARWDEAAFLRDTGVPMASMDTSDGLYEAVATLTAGMGAEIAVELLPYHQLALECAGEQDLSPVSLALGMGDWNMLYAMSPAGWRGLSAEVAGAGLELTMIGQVVSDAGIRWHDGGKTLRVQPAVNQHFVERLEDEGELFQRLRRLSSEEQDTDDGLRTA
jgi:thiamine-monophosphate kinase